MDYSFLTWIMRACHGLRIWKGQHVIKIEFGSFRKQYGREGKRKGKAESEIINYALVWADGRYEGFLRQRQEVK